MCQDSSKTNKQQWQQQQQNIQLYTYCKLNVGFVTSVYMYMYIRGWYSRVIFCPSCSVSELYTHQHYFVKLHNEIIALACSRLRDSQARGIEKVQKRKKRGGNWGEGEVRSGNPPVHIISHFNLISLTCSHLRGLPHLSVVSHLDPCKQTLTFIQ